MSDHLSKEYGQMTLLEHYLTIIGIIILAVIVVGLYALPDLVLGVLAVTTVALLSRGLIVPIVRYTYRDYRDNG